MIAMSWMGGFFNRATLLSILSGGSAVPSRAKLNANSPLVATDNTGLGATDLSLPAASQSGAGSMSAEDKTKVDVMHVDVRANFGATGGGESDDSTAINNAIAYLAGLGIGGVVHFGSGTYLCMSAIVVAPNVLLLGEGQAHISGFSDPSVVLLDGRVRPSTPLIVFGPNDRGCSVMDMVLRFPSGTNTDNGAGKTGYGVEINATTGIYFYNVKFEGANNGSGVPTPGASDPGLVYMTAFEGVVFEHCTFHYGTRQLYSTGSGSGGPLAIRDCWFYDSNGEHIYVASNGDHDYSMSGCAFDPIYRTTIPSLGVDWKANGFTIESCSFYGYPVKGPTGAYLKVGGVGTVTGCKFVTNSTAILVSGCTVDFTGNNVIAYNGMNIQSAGSVVTGRGNNYVPATKSDQPAALEPFQHKRGVIINEPYAGLCAVDIGPDTFSTQSAYTPDLVGGANISATANAAGLIRITTIAAHGLETGSRVIIASVGGTTEANGTWTITKVDSTKFTLDGSTFTNAWTSGGTVQYNAFWYESYHVGGEPGTVSYIQYTSGVIHYARAFDQSSADGINAPNPLLGALVRLDCLDPQIRGYGTGVTLTHADVSPNVITPENYLGAITYHLPAIHPGLEYTIAKRPDVVNSPFPALSITIDTADSSKIFLDGFKDGVDSISNVDTGEHNACITLRAVYWHDTVAAADVLRWVVVSKSGTWNPADGTAPFRPWFTAYPTVGTNVPDSDTTLAVNGGHLYVLQAATLTANRSDTLGTTGGSAGAVLEILRLDVTNKTLAIVNGGPGAGTLYTFPASTKVRASFRFDGTDWALDRWAALA